MTMFLTFEQCPRQALSLIEAPTQLTDLQHVISCQIGVFMLQMIAFERSTYVK
jgi:hypothetical protein